MTANPIADWTSLFPAFANLDAGMAERLREASQPINVPAGQYVFRAGDVCENFLLVLDGSVRVQMTSESGREIVLYRVEAGATCVLTTACLLGHEPYSAEGITETDVQAIAIPAAALHDMLGRSAEMREFVFQSYGSRLANLMLLVEEVAFGRMDIRLARFLLERADNAGTLNITHQQLAGELGSAREVISRQLKEFERRELLNLSRGQIAITNSDALRKLINS